MPPKRRREGSGGSGGGGGRGGAGAGVGGGAGGRGGRRPKQPPPPPPRAPALKRRCRSFDLSVNSLFSIIFFLGYFYICSPLIVIPILCNVFFLKKILYVGQFLICKVES